MKDSLKFLAIICVLAMIYNYIYIFSHVPFSMHQWRQTDALSITLNYFQEGMNFFQPKIHLQQSIDGKAVGEFPIIYYINALIWHITGENYITPRLVNFIIVCSGLVALFNIGLSIFKNFFFACIAPLLLFVSPIFVFYTNNFILNVPALSCVFIGWYYFLNYHKNKSRKALSFSLLFFTLAGLLRTTMIMGFTPLLLIVFLEHTKLLKSKEQIINSITHKLALLLPLLITGSWIIWLKSYNLVNGSIYFLTTINPFWEGDKGAKVWDQMMNVRLPEFYQSFVIIFFVIATIYFLINLKKLNSYIVIGFLTIGLQTTLYFILWYNQYDVHDYYYIDYYLYTTSIVMISIYYIKNNHPQLFSSKSIQILGGCFFILAITYCAVISRTRYRFKDNFLTRAFISDEKIERIKYENWNYCDKLQAIETIRPYLRSIGIQREDHVLSIPDQSPNISLYFMDQKGYTGIYNWGIPTKQVIEESIQKGAKYLIINDPNLLINCEFPEYTTKEIGHYKNVSIFKLQ